MLTIDKIFDFMLSEFKGKTILVTGIVGKTSTVGMLESVLKASNKSVLRIYSKRITPLVLKSYIINFVTPELEYIVMEARMFYKKYIPYFSKTMKPYLSIILNVEKEHLGVNGIDTIDDIVENKAELIRYSKYAIVNGRDERLSKLKHKSNSIYYKNKKLFDTDLSQLKIWKNYNELIQPYINTYLSVVMSNIVFEASKILKLDSNTYIHSINHFTPVENRLSKQIIYDKEIIFDGEVSGVSRLKMLCNHFYKKAVIIIRTFTYEGEENENYELLKTSLLNFEKVYLFENVKEKDLLTERNTIIVSNHDFIKNISKDIVIFYHYGSYYRKFSEFSIDFLERVIK